MKCYLPKKINVENVQCAIMITLFYCVLQFANFTRVTLKTQGKSLEKGEVFMLCLSDKTI